MTSIVVDVLQSTGKLAKENIVLKVADLKRKLEAIKLEVLDDLKRKYEDFYPLCVLQNKLLQKLDQVTTNYEDVHNQIEKEIKPQMVNSVAEFHDVLEDLKKIEILKSVVWNIVFLHQNLETAKNCKSQHSYLNAAYELVEFQNVLTKIDFDHKKSIGIILALQDEYTITREGLIFDLVCIWNKDIIISNNIIGKNKKTITLLLKEDSAKYGEILKALYLLKNLRSVLKEFGKQFLFPVCEATISNNVKVSFAEMSCLSIDILNEHSAQPSIVFASLKEIFDFIHKKIFILPVTSENSVELTAMNELGFVISEDFCSLIVEKCLKGAIPKQSKQLEAFHEEMVAAQNFCNFLQSIGFCSEKNTLSNFIKNIDTLPVNKITQDVLTRARILMKKPIHQTVSVGVESFPSRDTETNQSIDEISKTKGVLSKSTFLFPKCQISSSMKELKRLFLDVKNEVKDIGPIHGPRVYYMARNICELYCDVVPTFHKEAIQNLPQQTAIFHNNCMYLVHILHFLGFDFEKESMAQIPLTFVDIIPEIKRLGTEAFLSQMRHQKQQLLQLIQEQAYQTMIDKKSVEQARKSIQQCLCQLQLLQKVWSDTLPSEVYFKAIGTLFNTCLEEITLRVMSMEDISADGASQMDSMFSILLKQGPELFKIQNIDQRNSVHLYVNKWFKFQDLQLILNASLREIVDRWSNGKGPLSVHFTADEVKHLIRALFQNTERRAAALAKIR